MKKNNSLITFITKHYFSLIVVSFIIYSLLLILRSSFVLENIRYFSLFDDMMISMRYAYNFAHGNGLVWNIGLDKVEGFSNPLWTMYMAFLHLLPISIEKMSFFVQLTGVFLSIGTLYYVRKIAAMLTNNSHFVSVIAVIFTGFYFPLNNWTIIQGTEVSVLTFLSTACVYFLLRSLQTQQFSLLLFVLLGLGTFVRLDFVVFSLAITGIFFCFNTKQRRKIVLQGIPLLVLFIMLQTGLRVWYYHELLPNTYFLKMTGYPIVERIVRGIYITFREFNLAVMLIPFIVLFFTKNKQVFILLTLFLVQIFYSMYVGGDAWEFFGGVNRYDAIVMPLFFIALTQSMYITREAIKKKRVIDFKKYRHVELWCLIILFIFFNTASDNMLLYMSMVKPFPTREENAFQVRMAHSLLSVTKPDAKIGIVQAGVVPYFSLERRYIDLFGKNEKVIARRQSHTESSGGLQRYLAFLPGHTKWDYHYVVTKLKPDIFGQMYPSTDVKYLVKDYRQIFTQEGFEYYIRNNSKQLRNLK